MVKIKDLPQTACYYGYFQSGRICLIPQQITRYYLYSRRLVQTLADISGKDKFLYSINYDGEIYFVRKIKCVQNRVKKGEKK